MARAPALQIPLAARFFPCYTIFPVCKRADILAAAARVAEDNDRARIQPVRPDISFFILRLIPRDQAFFCLLTGGNDG